MQGLGKDVLSLILYHLPINAVCSLARTSKCMNKQISDIKYFENLAMKIAKTAGVPPNFCERCRVMHNFPNIPLKCADCKSRSCVLNCCKVTCLGCNTLTSPNYDYSCNSCDSEMCKQCEKICTSKKNYFKVLCYCSNQALNANFAFAKDVS